MKNTVALAADPTNPLLEELLLAMNRAKKAFLVKSSYIKPTPNEDPQTESEKKKKRDHFRDVPTKYRKTPFYKKLVQKGEALTRDDMIPYCTNTRRIGIARFLRDDFV